MTPLTTLKARVDEAEEGSRELDVAIWCAVQPDYKPCGPVGCYTFDNGEIRWRGWKECPALTSSVDAALALIEAKLPGYGFTVGRQAPEFKAEATLYGPALPWPESTRLSDWKHAKHNDMVLAVISALLAALIAKENAAPTASLRALSNE